MDDPLHQNKMYTTYVLYSSKFNKIYIGFSGDITNRLLAHNDLNHTGWTAQFRPWELFYFEEFSTKPEAMKREIELITSRGRAFIWDKIKPLGLL